MKLNMASFTENLAQMPDISHLRGLEIRDASGQLMHTIPAIEGKLGSLKLYHALYLQFKGILNTEAAAQGLMWFAEHLTDAQEHLGKHPNIDLLLRVQNEQLVWQLIPLIA